MSDAIADLSIVVDGTPRLVPPGVTVAAALIDGGNWAMRRSVTDEARGPLCGMGSCFECRVRVNSRDGRRACLEIVQDGMRVETMRGDARAAAANDHAGATGAASDPALAPSALVTAQAARLEGDIVIVGAGPAGIAAALAAASRGRRVIVLDQGGAPGGQIWRHRVGSGAPHAARPWLDRLASARGVTIVSGASVIDAEIRDGGALLRSVCNDRGVQIIAPRVVLATGARERFVPFPGWTLPGVIGVGAAQALLAGGMSVKGKRVVLAGSGPLLLPVAAALRAAGAQVLEVAEQASARSVREFGLSLWRRPDLFVQALRYRAAFALTPYRTGTWIAHAEGSDRVRSVQLTDGAATRTVDCDLLCTGYGLVPDTRLARLLGCATHAAGDCAVVVDGHQATSVAGVYCAGESTGVGGVGLALAEGEIAGAMAAGADAPPARAVRSRARFVHVASGMARAFAPRAEMRELAADETIVCRCEDVTLGACRIASSAREAKLATRAAMGACQGRICGPVLQSIAGWPADRIRPPLEPVPVGLLFTDFAPDEAPTSTRIEPHAAS